MFSVCLYVYGIWNIGARKRVKMTLRWHVIRFENIERIGEQTSEISRIKVGVKKKKMKRNETLCWRIVIPTKALNKVYAYTRDKSLKLRIATL